MTEGERKNKKMRIGDSLEAPGRDRQHGRGEKWGWPAQQKSITSRL